MRIKLYILTFLLVLLCDTAYGDTSTLPPSEKIISAPATLKVDPVQEIRLGDLIAKFEKTSLLEIRNDLGSGSIKHSGEAGGSQYWLCYSLPGQRIWLISNGEMGGPNHELTQVSVISISTDIQANDMCPLLPEHSRPVSLNFGWIGTSKKDLFKELGEPSKIQGDNHIYFYLGKKPAKYNGQPIEFDVTGFAKLKIVDNKIISIYVSHVTSY